PGVDPDRRAAARDGLIVKLTRLLASRRWSSEPSLLAPHRRYAWGLSASRRYLLPGVSWCARHTMVFRHGRDQQLPVRSSPPGRTQLPRDPLQEWPPAPKRARGGVLVPAARGRDRRDPGR